MPTTDFFEALSLWLGRGKPIVAPSRIHRDQVGRQVTSDFPPEKALEAFADNVLVYRSAMGYMTHGASIPMTVQVNSRDGWKDVTDRRQGDGAWRLKQLLEVPNEDYPYEEWAEYTLGHLMTTGEAFSRKVLGTRQIDGASRDPLTGDTHFEVVSLEVFIPLLNPVPGSDGRIAFWERKWLRKDDNPVPSHEMIFVKMPNLASVYRGMSPIRPTRNQIEAHGKMWAWSRDAFNDRLAIDYHFQRKGPVDPEQMKSEFDEILKVREKAPSRPFASDDSWDVQQLGARTAKEMDYSDSVVRVREEILSGAGTPPVTAGYFDNATLANAQVSIRAFFRYYLIPAMIRVKSRMQMSLVPHFGSMDSMRLHLDTAAVRELVDDLELDALTLIRLQQGGVPFNEAVKMLNMKVDPIPGRGDEPHGVVPPPKTIGGAEERQRDQEARDQRMRLLDGGAGG